MKSFSRVRLKKGYPFYQETPFENIRTYPKSMFSSTPISLKKKGALKLDLNTWKTKSRKKNIQDKVSLTKMEYFFVEKYHGRKPDPRFVDLNRFEPLTS